MSALSKKYVMQFWLLHLEKLKPDWKWLMIHEWKKGPWIIPDARINLTLWSPKAAKKLWGNSLLLTKFQVSKSFRHSFDRSRKGQRLNQVWSRSAIAGKSIYNFSANYRKSTPHTKLYKLCPTCLCESGQVSATGSVPVQNF